MAVLTDCNRCGDCCEDIYLNTSKARSRREVRFGDPREDAVWEAWVAGWATKGEQHAPREAFVRSYLDAVFIDQHWHGGRPAGHGVTDHWSCDRFDPATRLCLAHDDRPPICRDFPWYGREPSADEGAKLSKRCAFRADVGMPVEFSPTRVG